MGEKSSDNNREQPRHRAQRMPRSLGSSHTFWGKVPYRLVSVGGRGR